MNWLELPAVKWILPIPVLLVIAPVVWWFFRATWRELDADAIAVRRDLAARGEIDYRPMVALTLVTFILTFQEYYGRPDFYMRAIHGLIDAHVRAHPGSIFDLQHYDELYMRAWWGLTRVAGYAAAARGLAAVLSPRQRARLRAARARVPRPRLDLRAVRGRDDSRAGDRQHAARLRRLLPDVQAGGPVVAGLRDLGDRLPRAVLHAGAVLPRLHPARAAQLRRGRDLRRWPSRTA